MDNRPLGRKKNVDSNASGNVFKRGTGLGLGGAAGKKGGYSGRPGTANGSSFTPEGGSVKRGFGSGGLRGGSGGGLSRIIIILIIIFVLSRTGLFSMLSGNSGDSGSFSGNNGNSGVLIPQQSSAAWNTPVPAETRPSVSNTAAPEASAQDTAASNEPSVGTGKDEDQASSAKRDRYTKLRGNGKDTATVMVYMCGTDLESRNGAGTSDLKEMAAADLSDKVNLIVYTGGCKRWGVNGISSSKNQIFRVRNGGLEKLMDDAWTGPMTQSSTLSSFIKWTAEKYPADRYELILWDHGSGSVDGYGYDENYKNAGSMKLPAIDTALSEGGVRFDFIGFDACLMATIETGLVLDRYADYMIASEETEPASGWLYTGWLNRLSENTSVPTLDIGKTIADDYYSANARYSAMTGITLSVTDLAELSANVPEPFSEFAASVSGLIKNDEYGKVANARKNTREFARSSGIDQVDISDLADQLGTKEGARLKKAISSAVRYNRTSANMSNAYGLSTYFPYRKLGNVDKLVNAYEAAGLDDDYTKCIREFASQELSGQVSGGGDWNPYSSIFGGGSSQGSGGYSIFSLGDLLEGSGFGYTGGASSQGGDQYSGGGYSSGGYSGSGHSGSSHTGSNYSGSMNSDILSQLLMTMLSGGGGANRSGAAGSFGFLEGADIAGLADHVMKNRIDPEDIYWTKDSRGRKVLALSESDWELIGDAELNVLVDDGEGYVDLGLDNVYEWNEDGQLLGTYDGTWLAMDGHVVAYYHLSSEGNDDDYVIRGYIPAFVNGERAQIFAEFSDEKPDGEITGWQRYYADGETDTIAKVFELRSGDKIDFICDYYSYSGDFIDNYYLGESYTYRGKAELSNIRVGKYASAAYKLTDIYNQSFWTPLM